MSGKVEVVSHLREVVSATEQAMRKAARMVGGTVEGHAKELCPTDTGLLKNSIMFAIGGEPPNIMSYRNNDKDKNGNMIDEVKGQYEGQADPDSDNEITVYVGTNVEYAPYQELGAPNANVNPQPFLRPAMEMFRDEIENIVEKCLKEIR